MKKIISTVLMVTLLASFAGCSSTSTETAQTAVTSTSQTATDSAALPDRGKGMGGGLGGGSLDTSAIKTKYTDVAYGSISATQKLDVYLPNEGNGPFPVIVAIHGGAFKMGNKTGGDLASMIDGVNHGYAVVSVDYRLSGEAIFPAAISDVKAAIRFIKANAEKYNLNPDKIAVWGDSAGGNLAALAGTSGDDDTLNGDNKENMEFSSAVQAVVDWFGPLDFLKMDEQFKASGISPIFGATSSDSSPESEYIGGNITQNEEQTKKANPENYITAADPYFFIQHGSADQNVPTQQSINFADKLTKVIDKSKVTSTILDGASHGGSQFESDENITKVYGFLDGVLK